MDEIEDEKEANEKLRNLMMEKIPERKKLRERNILIQTENMVEKREKIENTKVHEKKEKILFLKTVSKSVSNTALKEVHTELIEVSDKEKVEDMKRMKKVKKCENMAYMSEKCDLLAKNGPNSSFKMKKIGQGGPKVNTENDGLKIEVEKSTVISLLARWLGSLFTSSC